MKNRVLALACLLMWLLGTRALAQTMQLAEKERIDPNLPAGMVLKSAVVEDGAMHIVIDTYATDWDMVATAARVSNTLVIHPGIYAPGIDPKDPASVSAAKGNIRYTDYYRWNNETLQETEQRIASELVKDVKPEWGDNGDRFVCSYQGWEIGRFDEGTGLFLPREISSQWDQGFAACWRMKDGSLRSERVRISVSYSDLQPVYVKRQKVAKSDVAANAAWGPKNESIPSDKISIEKADGRLVYRLTDPAEVFTAVAVPSWANEAYLISNGEETRQEINTISGKRSVILHYNASKQNCLYKKDWAIKWVKLDENDEIVKSDVYALEAEFHVGNPELTVTYDRTEMVEGNQNTIKGAEPLPKDSLTWTVSNPLDGLDAAYADGMLYLSVDESKLPPNRKIDLSQTTLIAMVRTPDEADGCTVYRHKGDVIYGNNGERIQKMGTLQLSPGQLFTVQELTRSYFQPYYYTLHNGKRICYYAPQSAVGQYGGETLVFEWLKQGKPTGTRQYVAIQSDGYELAVRRNQSLDEKVKDTVQDPMVVPFDAADKDMSIEAAFVPQVGDTVVRYDVVLYDDETGERADPGHPVLLYLPYPEGKSAEEMTDYEFVVHHPLKDGTYEEYSTAKGNLTLTEYGLCMEVTSFSPYYLSWEPVPDATALPDTGDRSAIWLCMMMLAASAAGAIAIKKKNKAAA